MALIIACIGASPVISRYLIYIFYKPNIDIWLVDPFTEKSTYSFDEVGGGTNFHNGGNSEIKIEIEYRVNKPLKLNPEIRPSWFSEQGLIGGGFKFRTIEMYLPSTSTMHFSYPFLPFQEEYTLEIIIYSKIKMSDLNLPLFLGETDLQIIKKTVTIVP